MSDLHNALGDLGSIRRQVASATQFRGYGPATLAATGALALCAAWVQSRWVPAPAQHVREYLVLWLATAVLGSVLTAVQMYWRTRRMHSGLSNEMLRQAVEQFLPAALAGALLTLVLAGFVPAASWMLPGLWMVLYALGVFSSCRFLPRAMLAAGGWYLLVGLVCVALGDARALAPWTMGLGFGLGQVLVAGVLYAGTPELEEDDDED
jgi:hypothetical protein